MTDSILESTKKLLGLDKDYKQFDMDVIMYINSTFATLNELGVGPPHGFAITDDTKTWQDFMGYDPRMNSVQLYVYYKTRLSFDPPAAPPLLAAMKEQIRELEWRLEAAQPPAPLSPPVLPSPSNPIVFDGGSP